MCVCVCVCVCKMNKNNFRKCINKSTLSELLSFIASSNISLSPKQNKLANYVSVFLSFFLFFFHK